MKNSKKITLFMSLAISAAMWSHSYAQNSDMEENIETEVEADEMNYLEKESKITATGNVNIKYGQRKLNANKVTYNQNTGIIKADGNIHLIDEKGNEYFAKNTEINDSLTKGTINNLSGRLADNSLFAAKRGIKESADIMVMESARYSPCKVCSRKNGGKPLWQISADKVTFDDIKERIYYENASFDIYGQPVLFLPYLSHAAPGAKKKSGFLIPTYSQVSTLGSTIKTPYYFDIKPNIDATIEPILTTEEGVILSGTIRHLTEYGQYELSGSITTPVERDNLSLRTDERDLRGHIEGIGKFNITDTLSWGFDIKRSTDDTYLQRYKFGNEDLLTSKAYIENIDGRNYAGMQAISFQGLNVNDDPGKTPLVLPLINVHYEMPTGYKSSRWTFDGNALAISRGEGVNSRRLSGAIGWNIPYITENGHIFKLSTKLRGDIYSVENVINNTENVKTTQEKDGFIGRFIPEAKLGWSFPLAKYSTIGRFFLEPLIDIIISPNGGNPAKIPNEDSQELELSDVNLFSENHFTGLDRVESGARTNYGVRGGISNSIGDISFLFGQNYRINEDKTFTIESGLGDNFSDYVGRISLGNLGNKSSFAGLSPSNIELSYRFRIDKDNFTLRRNEIAANIHIDRFVFNLGYILLDEENELFDRQEFVANAAFPISNGWSFTTGGRRNLENNGGWISISAGLVYENECLKISNRMTREFTRDRDIEPSTSYTVRIAFKNLGQF